LKILLLAPEFPVPAVTGGRVRTLSLIRELSRRHSVSLLAFSRQVPSPAEQREVSELCTGVSVVTDQGWPGAARRLGSLLQVRPRAVTYYDQRAFRRELDRLLCLERFDILQAETSYLAAHVLDRSGDFKRVVVFLDLNWLLSLRRAMQSRRPDRQLGYLMETLQFLKWERDIARNADAAIAVSEKEKLLLSRLSRSARIHVIPNGVDVRLLKPDNKTALRNALIFVGSHEHPPNLDAGVYFLERILPVLQRAIPSIRVFLVGLGGHPRVEALVSPQVVAVPPTPEVLPYYAAADFAVAPIRVGAGTRLKILEAMSLGLPVVSTSLGCEGLKVDNGVHLLIRDHPSGFAQAVSELYRNPDLACRLRRSGRSLVEQEYAWSGIARDLEHLYERIVGQRPSGGGAA